MASCPPTGLRRRPQHGNDNNDNDVNDDDDDDDEDDKDNDDDDYDNNDNGDDNDNDDDDDNKDDDDDEDDDDDTTTMTMTTMTTTTTTALGPKASKMTTTAASVGPRTSPPRRQRWLLVLEDQLVLRNGFVPPNRPTPLPATTTMMRTTTSGPNSNEGACRQRHKSDIIDDGWTAGDGLVLILAGGLCYTSYFFWYIPTCV